eukprot:SAG11_NODE_74_length_18043_cov_13.387818_9_plen_149_part_00
MLASSAGLTEVTNGERIHTTVIGRPSHHRLICCTCCHSPQLDALCFVGYLPMDEATFGGRFTVDGAAPTANGMPHYSNEGGTGHLYYWPKTYKWVLDSEFPGECNFTGKRGARLVMRGGVPVGESVWRYHDGIEWGDRALTVVELTPD